MRTFTKALSVSLVHLAKQHPLVYECCALGPLQTFGDLFELLLGALTFLLRYLTIFVTVHIKRWFVDKVESVPLRHDDASTGAFDLHELLIDISILVVLLFGQFLLHSFVFVV